MAGLSPRVRGNRNSSAAHRGRPGSIPASAGQPMRSPGLGQVRPVYPRECGATLGALAVGINDGGLSPRVRGNLSRPPRRSFPDRSIPASAGQPVFHLAAPLATRVYPRECGATLPLGRWATGLDGLSPRVRGNRIRNKSQVTRPRSIPASAGQPPRSYSSTPCQTVYPRECGATGPRSV